MVQPKDMASRYDLDNAFDAMRDCFEDKETEQNWSKRDAAITHLIKLTMGNSPKDFRDCYIAGIKSLIPGIIKAVISLVCHRFPSFNRALIFPSYFPSSCHASHPLLSSPSVRPFPSILQCVESAYYAFHYFACFLSCFLSSVLLSVVASCLPQPFANRSNVC